MAEDGHRWELFGAAGYYHRPTGTLYIMAEYLVDLLCLPRTTSSAAEVLQKECQRFAEEYPEKLLFHAVVLPFPGVMAVEVMTGGVEEQRWTTTERKEGPNGPA